MRSLRPVALIIALAGCYRGDALSDGMFSKGDLRVRFGPVPGSWRRIEVPGADLAFRDDARQGSALFDVRCGGSDNASPLVMLTENLIMCTTERNFEVQEVLAFDRREAMHTLVGAKLDGVPLKYGVYVMEKGGCWY